MTEFPAPDTRPHPDHDPAAAGLPVPAGDVAGLEPGDPARDADAGQGAGEGAGTTEAGDSAPDAGATSGSDIAAEIPRAADEPLVAATRRRLAELDGTPVASHVAVYDELHGSLQGALAGLDEG